MHILLLGGREFLGRALVESARARGHRITLFNRGKTNPELFADLPLIRGDRNRDFDLLRGLRFDAVIDTSGYLPDPVGELARTLAPTVGHYVFVSTCSVYDFHSRSGILDETAPLVDLAVDRADTSWDTYGARKYLCERVIEEQLPGRATLVRPGLIVGPHDSTYRFPYWPERIADGGTVLAPGHSSAPTQFLDARDLAAWLVHLCETPAFGAFNAVGPAAPLTLGGFLDTVVARVNPQAKLEWVPEAFLRERQVACWSQLPLWAYEEIETFVRWDAARAIRHGLRFRPLDETILDTLAWSRTVSAPTFRNAALPRAREAEVLREWQACRR